MRSRGMLAILGALALLLAACASAATPTPRPVAQATPMPPTGPIRIGVIGTFSGALAGSIKAMYNPLEWLFQQDGMQVAGRPVQFIWADDENKLDVFMSKVKRLIEIDKVHLIVGPPSSGLLASAEEWMGQQPTVWIIPEGGTFRFYPPRNAVRATGTSGHQSFPEFGKYLADTYGVKKAVIVALDYAAGRDYAAGIKQMSLPGGKIEVIQEFYTPLGTPDFGPIISKIQTGPDVMITGALWSADMVRFVQQAEEFGLKKKVKIFAFPGGFAVDDAGLGPLGKAAEGMLNLYDVPPPDYPSADMERFVDAFKLKFGTPPGFGWRGLTTYLIVKQAVETVKGNVEDREALSKAIRQPIKTPAGTISFDECGNSILPLYLKEVKLVGGLAQTSLVKTFPDVRMPCPRTQGWWQ